MLENYGQTRGDRRRRLKRASVDEKSMALIDIINIGPISSSRSHAATLLTAFNGTASNRRPAMDRNDPVEKFVAALAAWAVQEDLRRAAASTSTIENRPSPEKASTPSQRARKGRIN
ncbi:hypothetical protein [Beijerinckia sp. L45]|uniref:hypothetical protein n=1 Tax=Beijerinckia sp. L45 TaxID=1641855 RepID=UPI00131B659E|nr:hypothetical protein [Beijerinckia sp. L45]